MTGAGAQRDHAAWIAEKVQALLASYGAPAPGGLGTLSVEDWTAGLLRYSREAIEHACDRYREEQPERPPVVSDIARRAAARSTAPRGQQRAAGAVEIGVGDRSKLSFDERRILEDEVLPRARSWLDVPGLADQGRRILLFWGETF